MRRRSTVRVLAQRSRIVLKCAGGHSVKEVSRRLRIASDTVRAWRRRFLERDLDSLCDEPRPGAPRKITDADVERVIVQTLEETPKNATHWSTRSMAAATGMSQSAISRIWRAFALAPHRTQTFKLSTGPAVHRQGPRRRRPLSRPAGEGPGPVRGREVTDPGPAPIPTRVADDAQRSEHRSHGYIRAGTTTLFATLELATGKVIGSLHRRHRAVEFKSS